MAVKLQKKSQSKSKNETVRKIQKPVLKKEKKVVLNSKSVVSNKGSNKTKEATSSTIVTANKPVTKISKQFILNVVFIVLILLLVAVSTFNLYRIKKLYEVAMELQQPMAYDVTSRADELEEVEYFMQTSTSLEQSVNISTETIIESEETSQNINETLEEELEEDETEILEPDPEKIGRDTKKSDSKSVETNQENTFVMNNKKETEQEDVEDGEESIEDETQETTKKSKFLNELYIMTISQSLIKDIDKDILSDLVTNLNERYNVDLGLGFTDNVENSDVAITLTNCATDEIRRDILNHIREVLGNDDLKFERF